MAAFVGMIFQETGITFPAGSLDLKGEYPIANVLDDGMGFPALANIPPLGLAQILLFAAIVELYAAPAFQYTGGPQNLPGGYEGSAGRIPGGYPGQTQITDPVKRDRALNVEIQNGRAAMMGVTGAMMHSMLDSCDHHFFYPFTHN
uniref:Chlorophyll a-b binding protein, chloroplastic n=2 Tax=Entomoneis paludosa TaxID=265537 RepID=A0A7S3DW13_9STRA|mmetsp:Transcript_5828/g.12279  ORF Transcript_5828/g.12279 Transcript_5828/m.12279 type:complete len:146 (+) Transcript_5828:474-911(+)